MDIKELIEKQKQKMFEVRLQKIVDREDLTRWSKQKTYIEIENEKLQKGGKNGERKLL